MTFCSWRMLPGHRYCCRRRIDAVPIPQIRRPSLGARARGVFSSSECHRAAPVRRQMNWKPTEAIEQIRTNRLPAPATSRSRLVAASQSHIDHGASPRAETSNSPSCSTRKQHHLQSARSSPISSDKACPSAASKRPTRSRSAPVKALFHGQTNSRRPASRNRPPG